MVYCSRLKKGMDKWTTVGWILKKILYDKQHAQFSAKVDTFKRSKRSYKIHLSHAYLWFIKTRRGGEPTADHHSASTSSSERHWRRLVSFPTIQVPQHTTVCVSVAQEGEDAPLRSFCLFSWFVLSADPLCSWIHSSNRTSLLHHLFKHTFSRH